MLTNNSNRKAEQVDAANPRANNLFGHIVEMTPPDGDHAAPTVRLGDPGQAAAIPRSPRSAPPSSPTTTATAGSACRTTAPSTRRAGCGSRPTATTRRRHRPHRRRLGARDRGPSCAAPRELFFRVPIGRRDVRPVLHARRRDLLRRRPASGRGRIAEAQARDLRGAVDALARLQGRHAAAAVGRRHHQARRRQDRVIAARSRSVGDVAALSWNGAKPGTTLNRQDFAIIRRRLPCGKRSRVRAPMRNPQDVGSNPTDNPTIGDVIAARFGRRDILKGALGVAAIAATVSPLALAAATAAQAQTATRYRFDELEAGVDDKHHVAAGYDADILIRWGDPVVRRRARVRSAQAERRRAAAAVRLQLRLHRLLPDAGRRQSVASRPARREPRIHQRRADVPGPQAAGRQGRDVRRHDQGPRRHRDGRAWRRGDRGRSARTASGRSSPIRNMARRIDATRRWRSPGRRRDTRACRPRPIRPAGACSA